MTELLDARQRAERQYVSMLADIIENTHTFRRCVSAHIFCMYACAYMSVCMHVLICLYVRM